MTTETPAWVKDAIFYQIFPDRFCRSGRVASDLPFEDWDDLPTEHGFKGGDLFGVTEKLDYLADLGITAIYLNPIFSSACNHRYHTYDYYNVDPLLGGNDAFRELLDAAHARDIRIVIDGVFNHASRGFWQFHHVLETGNASPYRHWFHFNPERLEGQRPFQPYPSEAAQQQLNSGTGSWEAIGYSAWWNLPALPKFNTNTPAVRDFLFDVAEYWIRFGADGWRLDVPSEIDDDEFWREFRSRVKAVNPDAYIVGEIWDNAERWLQGDQFDAVMNYPISVACMGFFGGETLDLEEARKPSSFSHVDRYTAEDFANHVESNLTRYPREIVEVQLNLLDSHDMPRFLTCVGGDIDALRLSWLFACVIPGSPCLYYGDEVALDGRHDPDCRKGFPWDESHWNSKLLASVKEAIHIRKQFAPLRHGSFRILHARDGVCAILREHESEFVIAGFNAAEDAKTVEVNAAELTSDPAAAEFGIVLSDSVVTPDSNGTLKLEIPPRDAVVLTGASS